MIGYRNTARVLLISCTGLTSCATGPADRPIPLFNPDSRLFFDAPWPSDARVDTATGFPILQASETTDGYPNPEGTALLQTYMDTMQSRAGFGTNAPAYFRFGTPLPNVAVHSASASLSDDAPIRLINVDPFSPNVGQRVPVQLEFFENAQKFTPSNLLAVAPYPGFPLEPETTYAIVITTDIAQRSREFSAVWTEGHPHYAVYTP